MGLLRGVTFALALVYFLAQVHSERVIPNKDNDMCGKNEQGEDFFFAESGYRKCSTSCDEVTRMFAKKYTCNECCFYSNQSNVQKERLVFTGWKIVGPYLILTIVLLVIALVVVVVFGLYRSKRKKQENIENPPSPDTNKKNTTAVQTEVTNIETNELRNDQCSDSDSARLSPDTRSDADQYALTKFTSPPHT